MKFESECRRYPYYYQGNDKLQRPVWCQKSQNFGSTAQKEPKKFFEGPEKSWPIFSRFIKKGPKKGSNFSEFLFYKQTARFPEKIINIHWLSYFFLCILNHEWMQKK
jgi:hypothetical protein